MTGIAELPRNMTLKAFDPHQKAFVCMLEDEAVPDIDPVAEDWFQEALALTSLSLRPEQRDYARALHLWQQATDRKHWKAMINLANAYAQGDGVMRDTERALLLVEDAMRMGIPAAFDLMGSYHMEGKGVKQDASRAYAFWELAANMGSAAAQGHIGKALRATYDDPERGFWGNRAIGLRMMECGAAQGDANASFFLGLALVGNDRGLQQSNERALSSLHLPLRYEQGELFDRSRTGLQDEDGRIQFHYLGMPVDLPAPPPVLEDPRVRRRVARYAEIPQAERRYRSHSPCPHSGIWRAYLPEDHPKHQSFNRWDRQVYVRKGMPFPDVIRQRPGISEKDLLWQWLGNANEEREGLEHISLTVGDRNPAGGEDH